MVDLEVVRAWVGVGGLVEMLPKVPVRSHTMETGGISLLAEVLVEVVVLPQVVRIILYQIRRVVRVEVDILGI
jgi:hypothetical protein